jgi:hypothetical protein
MKLKCLISGHDDYRLAVIGGVIEIVKCQRCKRLTMREF